MLLVLDSPRSRQYIMPQADSAGGIARLGSSVGRAPH